ncbi:hypothetical protein [Candidatus Methanodesulfokora washburnensis]|uniref:Uncharacterized protein n=1 Tax=Candidatus Methanodesulfokora washburnensis TaxID=2478471 RepID=A0A3R9X9D2_9CREN|nr:hypothetical protein [Candidatus Methanodesulfokores washburnensis]RSN78418.1 hypothetical protein D6D85_00925 [Candidatus Methanodesulfokores washburnensis]
MGVGDPWSAGASIPAGGYVVFQPATGVTVLVLYIYNTDTTYVKFYYTDGTTDTYIDNLGTGQYRFTMINTKYLKVVNTATAAKTVGVHGMCLS